MSDQISFAGTSFMKFHKRLQKSTLRFLVYLKAPAR